MKAQMLKIAGVKSEKEFYKKFPDEASFMKAHGKEFKKAMRESKVKKAQFGDVAPSSVIDESAIGRPAPDVDYSYLFEDPTAKQKAQDAERDAAILGKVNTSSQNFDSSNPTGQDLLGMRASQAKADKRANFAKNASPYIQAGSDIARGVSMIKEQKKQVKRAQQNAQLTGVQAAAVASTPINPIKRQYVTSPVIQPDELFTSRGVGTNVLAQDGAVIGGNPTEIMNTFAPNTIYSDMGYEPLNESRLKQYQQGGQLYGMMNDSRFGDVMNQGGDQALSQLSSSITGEEDAGTAIGGGIGQAAGQFFLGPVGGKVGKEVGRIFGDLIDQSERKIKKSQKQSRKNIASMIGAQAGMGIQDMFSANMRAGGYVPKAQTGKNEKGEKDLTQKDGKCEREEKQKKVDAELSKASALADKAGELQAKQEAKQIAATHRADYAKYIDERLGAYGEKMKQKDFDAAYQAFAAQNPELAKDRMLYTVASKELPKLRSEAYSLRSKLNRIDPNLDYKSLTLPQLMQTMQKGFGGSEGYLRAWNEGFPERLYSIPQLTPIKQENGGQTSDYQWVSHTWQPQVITQFGEHKLSDLLKPPADADMLRAGGHVVAQNGLPLLPSNPSGYADSVINANKNIQFYKDVLNRKAPEISNFPGMFSETEIRGMDRSSEKNPYVGARTGVKPFLSYVNGRYVPIEGMMDAYEDKTIPSINFPSQYAARVFEQEMIKRTKKHRAGGEIRNLRKNYMSPEEEMMTNMSFGGQLETTWGGYAEPISQNPYLPGTGQTVMFRGQSHDESDGKGRTGIGVKYGQPDSYTEYAEYGTQADADVEVERNEPAVELPNGDGDNSMVVYGNLKIPNQFLSEIGDPSAKGKKFKTYVSDLSKKEKRQNKIIEKASEQLDNLNPTSPFDELKFNSLAANIKGANMKLKEYAEFKQNAAAVQNAINDTAEEMGLDADKLAKGKVTMAKQGANVPKAQTGSVFGRRGRSELFNVNPAIKGLLDLFAKKNYDARATSGYRAGSTTAQGKPSRHSKGEAMDVVFPILGAGAYDAILNDPEVVEYMLQNDITAINEYDPETQKATGATGPHIHFGFDKGTSLSDKFRKEAAAKYPSALTPITQTGLPKVSPENFKYLQDLYGAAQKEGRGPAVLKFQQEFHRLAPDYAKDVLSKYPVTSFGQKKGFKVTDLDQNLDSIFGKRTQQYMAALNSGMGDTPSGDMADVKELGELVLSPTKKTEKKETAKVDVTPKKSDALLKALSSMLPYLRPSDVEELDPRQLMGEMYALSTNQVEPVWAQKLTPRLSIPMDISLQDILNENRATLRRQQQMLGYDPAAQSAFAAQEYGANQRVLGEQFRLNQAEKQRVYEQNRNILNQFDLANMGVLDKQYERQAQALSKTKATTQEALNSIASKVAQNRLENRTLATMENLYNYRFDPMFRAQSMQLAQWNVPDNIASTTSKETPVYGPDGKTILYYKTSESGTPSLATPPINAKSGSSVKKRKDALNSTVVRALKNV